MQDGTPLISAIPRFDAQAETLILQESVEPKLSTPRITENELYNRIKKIIMNVLAIEDYQVTPTAHFIDDLKADSLKVIAAIAELEEEFDITIPNEEADKLQNIMDVYKYLEEKLQLRRHDKNKKDHFPFP